MFLEKSAADAALVPDMKKSSELLGEIGPAAHLDSARAVSARPPEMPDGLQANSVGMCPSTLFLCIAFIVLGPFFFFTANFLGAMVVPETHSASVLDPAIFAPGSSSSGWLSAQTAALLFKIFGAVSLFVGIVSLFAAMQRQVSETCAMSSALMKEMVEQ